MKKLFLAIAIILIMNSAVMAQLITGGGIPNIDASLSVLSGDSVSAGQVVAIGDSKVSGLNKAIYTFASNIQISNYTFSLSMQCFGMCVLSPTKAVFFRSNNEGAASAYYSTVNLSGNSVTSIGSEMSESLNNFNVKKVGRISDTIFWASGIDNNYGYKVYTYSVSGDNITRIACLSVDSSQQGSCIVHDTAAFNYEGNILLLSIITQNGLSEAYKYAMCSIDTSGNTVYVGTGASSGSIIVNTIGNDWSSATQTPTYSNKGKGERQAKITPLSGNKFALATRYFSYDSAMSTASAVTNQITYHEISFSHSNGNARPSINQISPSTYNIPNINFENEGNIKLSESTYITMSNDMLDGANYAYASIIRVCDKYGIALNNSGSVRLHGKVTNMSGLIPGSYYCISGNNFMPCLNKEGAFGQALSATDFLIY